MKNRFPKASDANNAYTDRKNTDLLITKKMKPSERKIFNGPNSMPKESIYKKNLQ